MARKDYRKLRKEMELERKSRRFELRTFTFIGDDPNSVELFYEWDQDDLESLIIFINATIDDYNMNLPDFLQIDEFDVKGPGMFYGYTINQIEKLLLGEAHVFDLTETCGCCDGLRFEVRRVA